MPHVDGIENRKAVWGEDGLCMFHSRLTKFVGFLLVAVELVLMSFNPMKFVWHGSAGGFGHEPISVQRLLQLVLQLGQLHELRISPYTRTYNHIYIYISYHTYHARHTCFHIHTYIYTYIYINVHAYMHSHTHTQTHRRIYTYTQYTYINMYIHIYKMHIHIHIHVYVHMHVHPQNTYAPTYTYTYAFAYTYTYRYICTYACAF